LYGRRRRIGGGAKRHRSAASRSRIGGCCKMQPTLGAGARRVSAAALRTPFSRQALAAARRGRQCGFSRISSGLLR
jgi:hypothetical protein